jgi:6-phosphofructokinase
MELRVNDNPFTNNISKEVEVILKELIKARKGSVLFEKVSSLLATHKEEKDDELQERQGQNQSNIKNRQSLMQHLRNYVIYSRRFAEQKKKLTEMDKSFTTKEVKATGRTHAVIVVSEAIKTEEGGISSAFKNMVGEQVYGGIGEYLMNKLSERYNEFQIRNMRLGHLQRSGHPVYQDRMMAAVMAAYAVDLLDQGQTNVMVGFEGGKVTSFPLERIAASESTTVDLNGEYVQTALKLGMYIGEI